MAKLAKVIIIPKFFREVGRGIQKYLLSFNRAATFDRWNDDQKLQYLLVYLEGTAETWCINWKRARPPGSVITWNELRDDFTKLFTTVAKVEVVEN